jgi:hypothetical protein
MEHSDRAEVDKRLVAAVQDDGRAFQVRLQSAHLVLERIGVDPHLSRLLRTGDAATRAVVVEALANSRFVPNFDYFAEHPEFRVRETVKEWVERTGDTTRWRALGLARRMGLREVVPAIRSMLDDPGPTVHARDRYLLLLGAAEALAGFGECDALARVADLAEADRDPEVRRKMLDVLVRAGFSQTANCRDAVPLERARALVAAQLAVQDHLMVVQALLAVYTAPALGEGSADRLWALLDQNAEADAGRREVQRRQALDALAVLRDPRLEDRLPVYFHDPMPSVRSSAIQAGASIEGTPLAGCLIGVLDRETESEVVFQSAIEGLQRIAGGRAAGLTDPMHYLQSKSPLEFRRTLALVFQGAEPEGLSRAHMVERWWRWFCASLNLDEAAADRTFAARAAFWQAADRGDAAGARKALEGVEAPPGLFLYEDAWLQARA